MAYGRLCACVCVVCVLGDQAGGEFLPHLPDRICQDADKIIYRTAPSKLEVLYRCKSLLIVTTKSHPKGCFKDGMGWCV